MTSILHIFIIAFLLTVSGCDGGSDAGSGTTETPNDTAENTSDGTTGSIFFSNNTNAAILTGATIGSASDSIADLRRIVSVDLILDNPDFALGDAYITRRKKTDTDYAYRVIEITNILL